MTTSFPYAVGLANYQSAQKSPPGGPWMTARQYTGLEAAEAAAGRLATEHPGEQVFIFQAIHVVELADVEVTRVTMEKQLVVNPVQVENDDVLTKLRTGRF